MSPGATSDGACRTPNTPAPIFAAIVRKSATRYVKKHEGSSSLSSSETLATGKPFADQRGFAKPRGGRDEG